jgi:hypothetical protein
VRGLLADLPRKKCWALAEHAGDASPDGMQHLLARAVWDADAVRDDVRALLVEHLGDPGAVLLATPPAGPRSCLPLPMTSQRTVKITIYGWSTERWFHNSGRIARHLA